MDKLIDIPVDDKRIIDEIIQTYQDDIGPLIPILQDLQDKFGYVSEEALEIISEKLQQPLTHIYGVTSFHSQFKLKMTGVDIITAEYDVKICSGSPCHVRDANKILERIEKVLEIKCGGVTPDHKFSIQTVECLGACGISPVVSINDELHGNLTPDSIEDIMEKLKVKADIHKIEERAAKHHEQKRQQK